MALSNRVWGAGERLAIAGALLLTFLLFFGVAMRFASRARNVVVPPLVGRTVNEASATLAALGLTLKVEEQRRLDPRTPEGVILEQMPDAGTNTRSPRSVRVFVSAGPRASRVPALVGLSVRNAEAGLQRDGFALGAGAALHAASYPVDAVVAQSPAAGAAAGSVSLLVNQGVGGRSYVMPDLIGTVASNAESFLREKGFRVSIVSKYAYPGVPAGIVLRQAPQGGYQVAPGDPISLEVSQ
jgi:beta-lactam-binding protein with PASTA domain